MRNKLFVSLDGITVAIQDGNTPKHLHANANEMQYILEGTGTIWLGDQEVRVKPGDLVVSRRARRTAAASRMPHPKAIAIKSPPQRRKISSC